MYKYILLDWDGNLAKTLDIWLEAFRIVLHARGLHPTDLEITACIGAPRERYKSLGLTDPDKAIDDASDIAKRALPNAELYPNAIEVIEQLREAGKKVALLTTSTHDKIEHLLEKYDMNRLFDAMVAGDDVKHHKPHPESAEKAIELLGGNKAETVIVGDSDKDLGCANNTGIDSILFYPPEHTKFHKLDELKQHNPTHIMTDFREILDIA